VDNRVTHIDVYHIINIIHISFNNGIQQAIILYQNLLEFTLGKTLDNKTPFKMLFSINKVV